MSPINARACQVDDIQIGRNHPLTVIAGPCLLESLDTAREVADLLKDACAELGLSYIFKASFDKANRSSITSPRGPGLEQGLEWLHEIGSALRLPLTTDIHEPDQAAAAAEVVSLIQIPAFLCRQTDLLVAAAETSDDRVAVNVKKGQFLSPTEMLGPIRKLEQAGCANVLLTERGTFFGYHRLVTDLVGLADLMELDTSAFSPLGAPPVCFDATHSAQLPGSTDVTGGRGDRVPQLASAAVAAGVPCVFLEVHPDPPNAMSDAATQVALNDAPALLARLAALHDVVSGEASEPPLRR